MDDDNGKPGEPAPLETQAAQGEVVAPDTVLHCVAYQAPEPALGGRRSTYKMEYAQVAAGLAQNGATDREIAAHLGVAPATFYRWQAQFREFAEAVRIGKEVADDRVERTMYQRAVGYDRETIKIIAFEGVPSVIRYTEHVDGDTSAMLAWLRARRPQDWRERREISGLDGQPIAVQTTIQFVDAIAMDDEDMTDDAVDPVGNRIPRPLSN